MLAVINYRLVKFANRLNAQICISPVLHQLKSAQRLINIYPLGS